MEQRRRCSITTQCFRSRPKDSDVLDTLESLELSMWRSEPMELTTYAPVPGQLPLWESGVEPPPPKPVRSRRPAGLHVCPNPECGYRPKGDSAWGRLREDLKVVWLVPGD